MSYVPTWTAIEILDNNECCDKVVLVKTTDLDLAYELFGDRSNGYSFYDTFYDDDTQRAWEWLRSEFGQDVWCNEMGLPWEFDIKEIAKCNNVEIIDLEGNDIKGEYLMSDKKNALSTSAKGIGDAAMTGVKLAAAGRANEAAYDYLKQALIRGGLSEELVNDQRFKEATMFVLPLVLHPLASSMEEKVPYAKNVKSVLEASIAEGSRRNSDKVMEIATDLFKVMNVAVSTSVSDVLMNSEVAEKKRIDINYDKFDVSGLKKIAKKRKLRLPSKAKRETLINLLEEYDAERESLGIEDEAKEMVV